MLLDYIAKKEPILKKILLTAALIVFLGSVLFFAADKLFPGLNIPPQFVPPSLLAAIAPALSILLAYELLLLTIATHGPFVIFVRREFEVISLIVLRDLFKILDELSRHTTTDLLTEVAIVMVGSIVLYFFVEVLERIERKFVGGALKKDLPGENKPLRWLKNLTESVLLVFFAGLVIYEGIGWAAGISGAGYGPIFLNLVFSAIIIFNMIILFLTLLSTDSYEVLFEHSALVLASVVVLIALPKDPVIAVPMIVAALLFVIFTMLLHGFARGESLKGLFKKLNRQETAEVRHKKQ